MEKQDFPTQKFTAMERKEFFRNGLMAAFGFAMVPPLSIGCNKKNSGAEDAADAGDCTVTPTETEGPFPTKSPSSLLDANITSDRTGVAFTIKVTINNRNADCTALAGAIVDIWHCDKDGNYSEYGGTGMQSQNYSSVHFLRGRQVADANGIVTYTSIFPGWYNGRAPHIHVHIYSPEGRSLLITQIAFPTDVCDTVYTTATQYYTKGKQDTSNTRDNVFSDSLASELATVSGNIKDGYVLTHIITVAA